MDLVGGLGPLQLHPAQHVPLVLPRAGSLASTPLVSLSRAVDTATHLPSYPVAVRTPYLNSWIFGNSSGNVPAGTINFWHGQTLGLEIGARINGSSYGLFGYPDGFSGATLATQTNIQLTSTHTKISLLAGDCPVQIDFFNPVSPKDFIRQSFPYSYITVTPSCHSSSVQVYTAIDESWTSQAGKVTTTAAQGIDGTTFFQITNPNSIPFTEKADMATWGTAVLGSKPTSTSKLSYECAPQKGVQSTFEAFGAFSNIAQCSSGYWSAIAHDLGTIAGASSATFALGFVQEQSINYLGRPQISYHRTQYPTIKSSITAFLNDYSAAFKQSQSLDSLIASKGDPISDKYTDILHASLVQSFGASELTVDQANPDVSKPYYFTKEISSDGNLNTLDIFYPTHPVYLALNPDLIKYNLLPLLDFLDQPTTWSENFAPHDLGQHYPNATGYLKETITAIGKTPEFMPLESTSILMILMYTYQKFSGDTSFAQPYQEKLTLFADYLRANGTAHLSQLQTVDGLGRFPNQTMLAVSSAVALASFGHMFDLPDYTTAGADLADLLWNGKLGTDEDQTHFTFTYGDDNSYTIVFPLFSDTLLDLELFPPTAYEAQSKWYGDNIGQYGLPYVSFQDFAISDWSMWAAAVASADVRESIINTLRAYLGLPGNTKPFQTKYWARGPNAGLPIQNIARSTVGSNFALAVLDGPWDFS